ncbi:MAG: single-stranded-DNA-specific exonuclease RecJ [Proteobacteria bacterium]|nr:single-stranded-DNA-specific exonuclease RecJ [Pseudomonadota bacterium]
MEAIIGEFEPANQSSFLNSSLKDIPNPSLLKGISQGVDTFLKTIGQHEKILILGDYDVDGITSTVLLVRFFSIIGYENFDVFIPNRFTHGYGLTSRSVETILERKPDLLITVDNGITAKNEIANLRREGIEVIVTDHHLPQEDSLPDCLIVNPKQDDCKYPYKNLSGVGVVFLFLIAVRAELRNRGFWNDDRKEPNLLQHLDLVALGTIADQVPLLGLNRILARFGLEQMTKRIQKTYPGDFFFYLKVFAEKHSLKYIDSDTIAFRLAPILNATGRMKDAFAGVSFLMSDNDQNAISRYNYLDRLNQKRRKKQKVMVKKALEKARSLLDRNQGLMVYDDSFHEGLIGIVASRLVDQFDLPSIVVTDGEQGLLKASCRSKNENIMEILQECQSYLKQFGGHAKAAGCSFSKENLTSFHRRFTDVVSKITSNNGTRIVKAVIEVELEMLTYTLIEKMKIFEPFGQENRKPVFMLRNLPLPAPTILTGKHLKWILGSDLEIVFWNGVESIQYGADYNIACTLAENLYRGERKRQLIVQAITPNG